MTERGVVVRPAAPDDVDTLVDLFVAVVDEGRWLGAQPPVDRAAQRRRLLEPTGQPAESASLVALVGDEIVGHAHVEMTPYKVAGLGMMVDARWRGRGVGRALVGAAIDAALSLGAHKLALQVWPHNEAARRLYLGHGFVEEGLLRRHYPRSALLDSGRGAVARGGGAAPASLSEGERRAVGFGDHGPGSRRDLARVVVVSAATSWRRPSP